MHILHLTSTLLVQSDDIWFQNGFPNIHTTVFPYLEIEVLVGVLEWHLATRSDRYGVDCVRVHPLFRPEQCADESIPRHIPHSELQLSLGKTKSTSNVIATG